jgi:uncharacterized protein (TIGR02145 family)/uncharacterized repeat protein (TIGR02543 family)
MMHNKRLVNRLGGYAKYLPVSALVAVLTALIASSFCTHTPDNCADGQELRPGMFCFDNKAWTKCGGKEYNPYAQFCSAAGALYDKCNGKDDYDPLREFCSGNKVVSKCGGGGAGGVTFDPETQVCVSGIVKQLCGNNYYDPNNEFCFNNIRIYNKCNGNVFDPTKEGCAGETVKPKCGTGHYELETQFCYNNNVYPKCNGNDYNPVELFCYGNATYSLCGGLTYDPSKQTCNGTNIVDILKCGGAEYDSAASFCYNSTIYRKCGGKVYDPSRQSCNGTNVVDIVKCGGIEYDGATSFCYNNTVYTKCGGNVYDPSSKTCNGTNIVDIVKFTVYFNANGGMDGADPPQTVKADSGKIIRIPGQQTISRNGYSFGGWSTSPSGTGTYYRVNDQYAVIGDVTLYVRWIPIRTITFDGNGSISGDPPEPMSADSGTAIVLPGNRTLAKTGYSFGGWNTNNTGTGIRYNADSAYTVTVNITLYAMWTYTLTTEVSPAGGGSVSRDPSWGSYLNGTTVTVTAVAASGYVFTGWSSASGTSAASGSTWESAIVVMNGAKTLTANFLRVQYSTGTFTDSRNNKTYKTVTIGGMRWMAENLNYQTPDSSWCYENADSNCVKYGRLYAWNAAMAACPSGWHLPIRKEWGDLAVAVGGIGTNGTGGVAGRILKSTDGWNGNANGTNEFEFSALPGGYRDSSGTFGNAGSNGGWWTATEYGSSNAYNRYVYYGYGNVNEYYYDKGYGYSVRCLQD